MHAVVVWRSYWLLLLLRLDVLAAASKCKLPCRNGGTCQTSNTTAADASGTSKEVPHRRLDGDTWRIAKGATTDTTAKSNIYNSLPTLFSFQDYTKDFVGSTTDSRHHRSMAAQQPKQNPISYCQCPVGTTGAQCEIRYETCLATDAANYNSTLCRNGNPCQRSVDPHTNQEFYHCSCDSQNSDLGSPFAAKFCQHASTVFCKQKRQRKKDDLHSFGYTAGSSFCYNNGRCKNETQKGHHHNGCDCLKGFSGRHCEIDATAAAMGGGIKKKETPSKQASSTTGNSYTSPWRRRMQSIFVFLGLMLLFLLGGVAFLIHHGNRQRRPTPPHQFQRKSRKGGNSALERARIPQQQSRTNSRSLPSVLEIEVV